MKSNIITMGYSSIARNANNRSDNLRIFVYNNNSDLIYPLKENACEKDFTISG